VHRFEKGSGKARYQGKMDIAWQRARSHQDEHSRRKLRLRAGATLRRAGRWHQGTRGEEPDDLVWSRVAVFTALSNVVAGYLPCQDGDPGANRVALKIVMLRRTYVDRSSGSFLKPPVIAGFPTIRRDPWRSRTSTRRLPLCAT
jgi:hypothetical protein